MREGRWCRKDRVKKGKNRGHGFWEEGERKEEGDLGVELSC